MDIRKISVDRITPADYNPRKDLQPTDEEYVKIQRSIETFGYVEPIVWNEQTGHIVGGHQRYKVLCENGATEIECVVVNLSETDEKTLNVSLNKITGYWDIDKLREVLEELEAADAVEVTGFDEGELEQIMAEYNHIDDLLEESFSDYSDEEERETFEMTFSLPIEERERVEEYIQNTPNAKVVLATAIVNRVKGLV